MVLDFSCAHLNLAESSSYAFSPYTQKRYLGCPEGFTTSVSLLQPQESVSSPLHCDSQAASISWSLLTAQGCPWGTKQQGVCGRLPATSRGRALGCRRRPRQEELGPAGHREVKEDSGPWQCPGPTFQNPLSHRIYGPEQEQLGLPEYAHRQRLGTCLAVLTGSGV